MKFYILILTLVIAGCVDGSAERAAKIQTPEVKSAEIKSVVPDDETQNSIQIDQENILSGIPKNSFYYPPENDECSASTSELVAVGSLYGNLRDGIVAAGFKPYQENELHECKIDEFMSELKVEWCTDEPEIESCAPTGTAPCRMTFSKDNVLLRIFTNGEERTIIGAQCSEI